MSFDSVAQLVPGGASALQGILSSPQLQEMAKSAGVNLADPKYLNLLLTQVKSKVESATKNAAPGTFRSRPVSIGQTTYQRSAVAHYRRVAAMM